MHSDQIALRDFLADRDVVCPYCRYNLRGAVESHCPECGKGLALRVEARDPIPEPIFRKLWLRYRLIAAAALALSIIGAIFNWPSGAALPLVVGLAGFAGDWWWCVARRFVMRPPVTLDIAVFRFFMAVLATSVFAALWAALVGQIFGSM
ncbi:MAG: hypothetical protein ACKVW3_14040 [Phycisphaerales bacterium]